MDLERLLVKIEADGFLLEDKGSGIEAGTRLEVRYEISDGWMTRAMEFERDAPTLLHPFRKAMFVYTGERPSRVLVRVAGFAPRSDYRSYPDNDDPIWDDDYLRTYQQEIPPPGPGIELSPEAPAAAAFAAAEAASVLPEAAEAARASEPIILENEEPASVGAEAAADVSEPNAY